MKTLRCLVVSLCVLLSAAATRAALGDESLLGTGAAGEFVLARDGAAAPVHVAAEDWPGVQRAARDLAGDIERVTGIKATSATTVPAGKSVVLVGTLGRSPLIDGLVASGKLNADAIRGQWESFILQTVDQPLPGVERALVIAGSDKRGTTYGVYEISQQIGVSPWYWWADVTPDRRDALTLKSGRTVVASPSVKYRGIFLNDEAPDLTNWVRAKFGNVTKEANPNVIPNVANYGREFYTRLFELMLRVRANYLWPAMWNNAFNEDDPENARLADEYGIVMGTSHQEPMLRAQKEWDWRFQKTIGTWNYAKHPEVLENFWREGVRRNKSYESIITMGLRGANDTEMAPGGPEANRKLLEHIVDQQREILRTEVNGDVTQVPQMWCLYKEVQEFYEHGMRVPDDITLLWAEDNWGNIRRLPTAAERKRPGGAGIYYHFDYHGGPRSYQWLNTSPIPKIWEQMSLAKQYGADRIWIVNVGHFKGYEFPMEYFMGLAWNTARWSNDNFDQFTRAWATREFGSEQAGAIADLMAKYSKYNGRRKPEMLAPDTYSLTDYQEAETVVADYQAVAKKAEEVGKLLPAAKQDAYYQLILFPAKASALVNELYLAAGRNALYAKQGRASAAGQAAETRKLFEQFMAMVNHFNGPYADGRWAHFMDQPVLGYTTWRDPPVNSLNHLKLVEPAAPEAAALGVAIEGTTDAVTTGAALPKFDSLNRQRSFIDVFNRGQAPFDFTATASAPWIVLSAAGGSTATDQRLWVSIDWSKASAGTATGTVTLKGAGGEVSVNVEAFNPAEISRDNLAGFAEGRGVVSIEPEHYSKRLESGANHWIKVDDYGRTLSGMRTMGPVDGPSATPGKDSPCLEYQVYLFTTGPVEVTAITAPTLNFVPDRGVRYAMSFDDEAPQIVTLVPQGYQAQNRNRDWEKSVGDNAHYGRSKHTIAKAGYHTLKIWMVDPAVVMQKLIVDLGGLKPSYLGPTESFRGPAQYGFGSQDPAAAEQRRKLSEAAAADRKLMMTKLGLKEPGPFPPFADDPNRPAGTTPVPGNAYNWSDGNPGHVIVRSSYGKWSNYDLAKAGPGALPDPLLLKNGQRVTTADMWWKQRRGEILQDFQTEIYGRIPVKTPAIKWEIVDTDSHALGGTARMKRVIGHIDNSRYPAATPRIEFTLYTPANAAGSVPVVVQLAYAGFPRQVTSGPSPMQQVLARGWGFATFVPTAVQADSGGGLNAGIIGLVNEGKPRAPDDWGSIAAWSWGLSRMIDYLETDSAVDTKRLAVEGHSRYGKAVIAAAAFEPRWAAVYSSCAGEGGTKLTRHNLGQQLDNVAGPSEYHWMAGNYLKYAGNWDKLPIDQHELIALVAPRAVFVTGGTTDLWSDPVGEFLACVAAGPVYRLLGQQDVGRTAVPAPDEELISGDIGYRMHEGGHSDLPNWPTFLKFADKYFR